MAKAIPHGTVSGYSYHKCRCDECKAANRAYRLGRREAVYGPPRPPRPVHGTLYRYKRGCRCEECKAANTKSCRRFRDTNPGYKFKPRASARVPHGTETGYNHYGCRCEECIAAHTDNAARWRKTNPDAVKDAVRRWREANPEKAAAAVRRYREANPDARRLWAEANPEKLAELRRLGKARRRARELDAFVEDVPRLEIFERDGWQCMIPGCFYPGVPVSLDPPFPDPLFATVDHVVPLSKGGTHERSNAATAHFRCNVAKGNREGIVA